MNRLPVFPLSSVLFPKGRMPLQIFEQRYLDMLKKTMKDDSGFMLSLIRSGREVMSSTYEKMPELYPLATYAKVMDFGSLENGKLSVTIEGLKKGKLTELQQEKDGLVTANVEWLGVEADAEVDASFQELIDLQQSFLAHPMTQSFCAEVNHQSAIEISDSVGQMLPIDPAEKYALLCESNPEIRLSQILTIVRTLGG